MAEDNLQGVWGCGEEVWAAGQAGRVVRYSARQQPRQWTLGNGEEELYAGSGCGADVWVGGRHGLWHFDGAGWSRVLDEADGTIIVVHRQGEWIAATREYGEMFYRKTGATDWSSRYIEDNLITDLLLCPSGKGLGLMAGAVNFVDLGGPHSFSPVEALRGFRGHLRSSGHGLVIEQQSVVILEPEVTDPTPQTCTRHKFPVHGELEQNFELHTITSTESGIWVGGRGRVAGKTVGLLLYYHEAAEGWCAYY